MPHVLTSFWRRIFKFDWKFGFVLITLFCIPRFLLVLQANQVSSYSLIGLIMFLSAITPYVFLTRYGRQIIGFTQVKSYKALLWAFVLGIACSLALYIIGTSLYNTSIENWYVYIKQSYNIPEDIAPRDKHILFVIMASTGMLFSPIGEELFFRGIVHSSFSRSLGTIKASVIDSAAFALTHIAHFGLVYMGQQWHLLPIPALIWTISMFFVCLLFNWCKRKTGSLLGAVVCHAGFNLGMMYCIFYFLS